MITGVVHIREDSGEMHSFVEISSPCSYCQMISNVQNRKNPETKWRVRFHLFFRSSDLKKERNIQQRVALLLCKVLRNITGYRAIMTEAQVTGISYTRKSISRNNCF